MITSDPSVITRAADLGINYFDTARGYQQGNNERMVAAALGSKRKQVVLSTKTEARDKAGALRSNSTPACASSTPITSTSGISTARAARARFPTT